jgi:hypothetical protein
MQKIDKMLKKRLLVHFRRYILTARWPPRRGQQFCRTLPVKIFCNFDGFANLSITHVFARCAGSLRNGGGRMFQLLFAEVGRVHRLLLAKNRSKR